MGIEFEIFRHLICDLRLRIWLILNLRYADVKSAFFVLHLQMSRFTLAAPLVKRIPSE